MSLPNLPAVDPNLTRECALDMILASIAMEEMALGHIMTAESENLQYALDSLKACCGKKTDIDELLRLNQSITNVLDIISQNQMLLKSKMDKAIQAMPCPPCPPHPTCPPPPPCPPFHPCKRHSPCSAVFKGANSCEIWRAGCALPWNGGNVQGKCIQRGPCDKGEILICAKGRFLASFALNVKTKSCYPCDIAINLQKCVSQRCFEVYAFKDHALCSNAATISMSGIVIDTSGHCGTSSLYITLTSPDVLFVESSMFSIVEI